VTGQRARRTGKVQGKREAIHKELQLTLRDLEMKCRNFLVSLELDTIASEWVFLTTIMIVGVVSSTHPASETSAT
jgi:hypothetical protein